MEDKSTAEGIVTEESSFTAKDGKTLYTKTWKAKDETKAVLVFIHGFSDHCNAYGSFFPSLAAKGIEIRSFDQRGWGRSVQNDKEKGLTGPTTQVLSDITFFMKSLHPQLKSNVPVFVMGHSMGGAQVLTYIAKGPGEVKQYVRGWLLESPFVAFNAKSKPSGFTVFAGRLAGKMAPGRQMVQKLDEKLLCRDEQVQKDFVEDKLCHDTGTLEGLSGMLDRASDLDTGAVLVPNNMGEGGKTRIWLSHGTKDGVCDFAGSERLWERWGDIEDKEFVKLDGHFHKLHAEPGTDKEDYANAVAEWILARLAPVERRSSILSRRGSKTPAATTAPAADTPAPAPAAPAAVAQ